MNGHVVISEASSTDTGGSSRTAAGGGAASKGPRVGCLMVPAWPPGA